MGKKEVCERCLKNINPDKEKYVLVGTYDKKRKLKRERFYHWNCWQIFFKEKVIQKQASAINKGMETLKKMGIDLQNETRIDMPKM